MILNISDKIRYLMLIKGVSTQELADVLGCCRANFNKKLRNNDFKVKELEQIADYLNVDFLIDFVLVDWPND